MPSREIRYATFPLDCEANRKAREAVEREYPELKDKRLTMGPEHGKAREAWMDAYIAAGGKYQMTPARREPGDPITNCPEPEPTPPPRTLSSNLIVQVKDDRGLPVQGIAVAATGPETRSGTTDRHGTVRFNGVRRGTYKVTATKSAAVKAETSAPVAKEGEGFDGDNWAQVTLPRTKRVPVRWLQRTDEIFTPVFGKPPGSDKVTKTNICVLEEHQEVPDDWIIGDWKHPELERKPLSLGAGVYYIRRYTVTYVPPSLAGRAKNIARGVSSPGGNDKVYRSWDEVPASESKLSKYRPPK